MNRTAGKVKPARKGRIVTSGGRTLGKGIRSRTGIAGKVPPPANDIAPESLEADLDLAGVLPEILDAEPAGHTPDESTELESSFASGHDAESSAGESEMDSD